MQEPPNDRRAFAGFTMEQFAVAAQHSGAIDHVHSFHFSSSAVDIAKEIRLGVTVIVVGWVAVAAIRNVRGLLGGDTRAGS